MDILNRIEQLIASLRDKIVSGIGDRVDGVKKAIEAIPNSLNTAIDDLKDKADSLTEKIGEKIDGLIDGLSGIVEKVKTAITSGLSTLSEEIATVVSETAGKIRDKITEGVEGLRELKDSIVDTVKSGLSSLAEKAIQLKDALVERIGGAISAIGEKISGVVTEAREKISAILHSLMERIAKAIESLIEKLEGLYQYITETLNKQIWQPLQEQGKELSGFVQYKANVLLNATMGKYTSFDAFMADISDPVPIAGAIATFLGGLMLTMVIMPGLSYAIRPALENIGHLAAQKFRPTLLSDAAAIEALRRGVWDLATVRDELALAGYSDKRIDALAKLARTLPSPGMVQEAYLRGLITEAKHDELLRMHGYTTEDIALFKALYYIIPSPSDIIRMAVREAFTPEIAQRFGQYEDLPQAFVDWAAKQGLSREWAERYWAAHWELPSATMGFEMLHRGIITPEELKLLLRALDVMPFWREKLIQLSYAPYTRVDVRRMYQLGILSYEDVIRSYKDIGYDDEKARNLAEFTVRYYTPEDKTELDEYKELTRSIYITAYKKGVIARDTAKNYLKAIGYREDDAELLLSIADAEIYVSESKEDAIPKRTNTTNLILNAYKRGLYNRDEALSLLSDLLYTDDEAEYYVNLADYEVEVSVKQEYLDTVKELYITRTIDKPDAIAMLGKLFLTSRELSSLFDLWDIGREMRTKKPTEAQFRAALQRGLITREEYENELRGLGYAEKYVKLLSEMAAK